MSSFLSENYVVIYRGAEILAALTGLLYHNKFKSKAVRIFIWFLVYVQFIEVFASYPTQIKNNPSFTWLKELVKGSVFEKNYWFYQFFWVINATLLFSYFFYKITKKPILKRNIKVVGYSFLIISLIISVINFEDLHSNRLIQVDLLSLIVIMFLTFSYFFELLKSDKILKFYKYLGFYISCGILLFWIVITPLIFYQRFYNTFDESYITLRTLIYLFTIVFMYATFTIGLIVSKPELQND